MKLKLSSKEAYLVRLALIDRIINSDVLEAFEKEYLLNVSNRLRRYENRKYTHRK
ncbi:hypothetical protein [Psychrobacillus phage Perkons]|nr:hypothetical protein [Psychrobacillus phage Perkons]